MFSRLLSIALATLLLYLFTMSEPEPSSSPKLEIRLLSPTIPAEFSPPVAVPIKLSVVNQSPSPATVLNWNSPLDARADILGVFEIRDVDSDEIVTIDTIKFARQLPPPREDFVEIQSGEGADAEVTLPRVPLVQGRRYTVQAKGWWQAVWEKPLQDIPGDNLDKLTGALRGEFVSEAVEIRIE